MSSTIPRVADYMRHVLTDVANEVATKSGFVRRRRKLDGASFVQTLVFGWMANPKASAEERAQVAASRGVKISAYGLDKRCDERAAECLRLVLEAAVGRPSSPRSLRRCPSWGASQGSTFTTGRWWASPRRCAKSGRAWAATDPMSERRR